jgi:hypothetical protein
MLQGICQLLDRASRHEQHNTPLTTRTPQGQFNILCRRWRLWFCFFGVHVNVISVMGRKLSFSSTVGY